MRLQHSHRLVKLQTEKTQMAAEQGGWIFHVEQSNQSVPLITSDDVCGLPRGVNMLDLDPWAKVDHVTQPIERNAMRLA